MTLPSRENWYTTAVWPVRLWLNLLLFSCLLPSVIGASLLFVHQYRAAGVQQEAALLQLARALGQAVDNELLAARTGAQALATDPLLLQGDLAAFHERARIFIAASDLATNVVLTDARGQTILNTAAPYGVPVSSLSSPEATKQLSDVLATGKPVLTTVFYGPVLRQPIMAMAFPVIIDGKTEYALSFGIVTKRFSSLLQTQAIPPGWVAAIINQQGVIVGRSQTAERFVGRQTTAKLWSAIKSTPEGMLDTVTHEGTPVLTAYSRSIVTNWSIAVGIPRATITSALWSTLLYVALGVMMLFGISILLARLVSRRIASSFEMLCAPAAALGEGRCMVVSSVHVTEAKDVADSIHCAGRLLEERGELIRAKDAELSQVHRLASFGSWYFDLRTGEARTSGTVKEICGRDIFHLNDMRGTLLPASSWEQLQTALQETIASGQEHELEAEAVHASGRALWLNFKTAAVRDGGGDVTGVLGTVLDVTRRRQDEERLRASEEEMRNVALHDPLTGLPNRKLIFEYGEHVLAVAQRNRSRCALLFVDLDRFKAVNDLYGHEMGDRLLQEVGKRLIACTRQEDLVGRLGGDEFVIIIPHLEFGRHRTETVAQHVIENFSLPFKIDTLELSISPSIGISCFPEHAKDMNALIHTADLAMYQVKRSGRGRYQHYVDAFEQHAGEAMRVEARLRKALRQDGLCLHYQPVIDIASGQVVGAEALLRLDDGESPAIGPDCFIPIAEGAGLIGMLGEWVAREACRQHALWRAQGIDIVIAINVSPLQFREPAFTHQLTTVLTDTGMDPAALEIEVTESTVMDNVEAAVKTLHQIRALGVKVALDDFGTGYSSLNSLATLPLDKLKVDQSFVRRVENDPASRAVTEAIISLARSLRLEVHGEGIESEFALDFLRQQGCHQAQGYWFSRPIPAADFALWIQNFRMQGATVG